MDDADFAGAAKPALVAAVVIPCLIGIATLLVMGGMLNDSKKNTTVSLGVGTTSVPGSPARDTVVTTGNLAPGVSDTSKSIWPSNSTTSFDDPTTGATSFMRDFVGMPSPNVGKFKFTSEHAGEIAVRPKPNAGPTTIVHMEQLSPPKHNVVRDGSTKRRSKVDNSSSFKCDHITCGSVR